MLLLSLCHREKKQFNQCEKLLNNNTINDSIHLHLISIESALLHLNNTNEIESLEKLLSEKDLDDETKAYIHYNIGKITSNKQHLAKCKEYFSKLFNSSKDYKFKYYHHLLKRCKALLRIPTCNYHNFRITFKSEFY